MFVCAQSDYKYCRHDRTDYHQITMEPPRTLDPTECKYAICHLIGTDNSQLDAFNSSNFFTFFDDIKYNAFLKLSKSLSEQLNLAHFTTVLLLG